MRDLAALETPAGIARVAIRVLFEMNLFLLIGFLVLKFLYKLDELKAAKESALQVGEAPESQGDGEPEPEPDAGAKGPEIKQ